MCVSSCHCGVAACMPPRQYHCSLRVFFAATRGVAAATKGCHNRGAPIAHGVATMALPPCTVLLLIERHYCYTWQCGCRHWVHEALSLWYFYTRHCYYCVRLLPLQVQRCYCVRMATCCGAHSVWGCTVRLSMRTTIKLHVHVCTQKLLF